MTTLPIHAPLPRRRWLAAAGGAAAAAMLRPMPAWAAAARTGWVDDAGFDVPAFDARHPEQPRRVQAIRARVRADAALMARLQTLAPCRARWWTRPWPGCTPPPTSRASPAGMAR